MTGKTIRRAQNPGMIREQQPIPYAHLNFRSDFLFQSAVTCDAYALPSWTVSFHMKIEVRLAQWLLASVFLVMGGYRLWLALHGVATSNNMLLLSAGEVLLGILIAAGWQLRALTLLAAALLIADAVLSHPFWRYSGGQVLATQLLQFMKNMGLVGGLILLSAAGGAKRR